MKAREREPEVPVAKTGYDPAAKPPPSRWTQLGLLILAPFAGLAYVVFLPLIGFVMLGWVVAREISAALRSVGSVSPAMATPEANLFEGSSERGTRASDSAKKPRRRRLHGGPEPSRKNAALHRAKADPRRQRRAHGDRGRRSVNH